MFPPEDHSSRTIRVLSKEGEMDIGQAKASVHDSEVIKVDK